MGGGRRGGGGGGGGVVGGEEQGLQEHISARTVTRKGIREM